MWRGVRMKSPQISWDFGNRGCGIPAARTAALGHRDDWDRNKVGRRLTD